MEASKCPKCGEEPFFIEHVEKWYCYGCNSYIDEEEDKHECPAVPEHMPEPSPEPHVAAPHPASPKAAEAPPAQEPAPDAIKEEAPCEPHEDTSSKTALIAAELEALEGEPLLNEAQSLLDSASKEQMPGPVLDVKPEALDLPVIVIKDERLLGPEPKPDAVVDVKVKMCSSCGQPLKFIEKYQRHYCYGCRKYATKEEPAGSQSTGKDCPECGGALKFIDKYAEWYCFTCKAYPLRAKKGEPAKPQVTYCPKCAEPLKLIEKYQRHYCYKCKEYAPKPGTTAASEAPKAKETKACPACKGDMKYIAEYNEWYCFKCKKYSLRPSKPILLL